MGRRGGGLGQRGRPVRTRKLRALGVAVALTLAGSVLSGVGPAAAAGKRPATSHLHAAATPATALVGTVVTVAGTVTPKASTRLALQRLVGKAWKTVGHATAARSGAFTVGLRAPKGPVRLTLRVVRAASSTTKAVVGATLHVRVVKTAFKIAAAPSAAATTAVPLAVAGTVTPRAMGSVSLDQAVGAHWVSIGKPVLSAGSTFAFTKALAAGSYRLRVSKPFSTTVAAGVSRSFTVVVTTAVAPPAGPVNPVVSSTTLTPMVVGRHASSTLTASLGTGPYSWSVGAGLLPIGLTLFPSGVVSGVPIVAGTTTFVARVTDALGHSGTATITATVASVSLKAWGTNAEAELGIVSTFATNAIVTPRPASDFVAVTGGYHFALAVDVHGVPYAWGVDDSGQMGQGGTAVTRSSPTSIDSLSGVSSVAAGLASAYAVKADGSLWSWGANEAGELGTGDTTPSRVPVRVPLDNVVAVSAGHQWVMALDGFGRVWTWGDGSFGELGDGSNSPQQKTPVQVPSLSGVVAISAGSYAAYALLADGTVRSWGLKEHGQLGDAGSSVGPYQVTPVTVIGLNDIVAINGHGFEAAFALHANGTVSAWGNGGGGEMGNGTTGDNTAPALVPGLANVTALASGHQTAYALRGDGTVASWGYDASNELGNGDPTFTQTMAPVTVPGLTNVVAIGAGDNNGYALATG